jgi:hypothetical protein
MCFSIEDLHLALAESSNGLKLLKTVCEKEMESFFQLGLDSSKYENYMGNRVKELFARLEN